MVPISRTRRAGRWSMAFGLGTLCALLTAASARADIVYLQDGTVLYGRVVQETEILTDKVTGQTIPMPKGNGIYAVYDGTRIVTFSRLQIDPTRGNAGIENTDFYAGLMRLERKPTSIPFKKPYAGVLRTVPGFDEKGRRTLKLWLSNTDFVNVPQLLTYLSAYQVRVFSTEVAWTQNYLVSELDRDVVKSLAANFPLIKDEKDPVEKRFRMYRFLTEAKWYDLAGKELDSIEKDLPKAKERVEKSRESLRTLEHEASLDFATRALAAGQLRVAQSFLLRIPAAGVDPMLNVRVNTLRVKADNLSRLYDQAMHFLRVLPDEAEGDCAEVLCEAAAVLREELHLEALDRLEPFVSLADQAEKAKKQGREPADKPEQLLARAVSGWLLGKESSDARPQVARKLWKARTMAATYIRTPILRDRNALLDRYQKDEPVEVEELARIIALLPPPEPVFPPVVDELQKPQERKTNLPGVSRNPVDYVVSLPPEYRPGRPYPVLLVLHHDGETPKKVLERYQYEAFRNGYVLVAAEWGEGFGGKYQYSAEEQQRVLDVLRDVRLHYHVDADRVFLSGVGEGGNAAWDIGLSHPDLFAAVVPVGASPRRSVLMYLWPNAVHLPFYNICGEMGGETMPYVLKAMEFWINKGYPCLNVMYQGRGQEWFAGELPIAFDWMNRRKRIHPFPELGKWPTGENSGLCTMRAGDKHFYWLTADAIRDGNLLENKKGGNFGAARLQAIIRPGNQITISSFGLNQLTLWLGPGMIDFTRPVAVHLRGFRDIEKPWTNGGKPLKPDISLMMEDFLERGDNTHLFVVKIPFKP